MAQRQKGTPKYTIGLLGDELHYDIPVAIFRVIRKMAAKYNLNLLYLAGQPLNTPYAHHKQSNILYHLANKENIDGLIIMSNLLSSFVTLETLEKRFFDLRPLPMVSLGIPLQGITSVVLNNTSGMCEAVSHLIEVHGYQKIGFFFGPPEHPEVIERFTEFKRILKDHKLALDEKLFFYGNFQFNRARQVTRKMFKEKKLKPGKDIDAIVCCNDFTAAGFVIELQNMEFNIPDDIAVVGFDNLLFTSCFSPSLSTIHQPFTKMAEKVFFLLKDKIEGKKIPLLEKINSTFIARTSCGCSYPSYSESNTLIQPDLLASLMNTAPDKFIQQINPFLCHSPQTLMQNWQPIFNLLNLLENQTRDLKDKNSVYHFTTREWTLLSTAAYNTFSSATADQTMSNIGIFLSSTLDLDEVLNILSDMLPKLDVQRCCLCLYENKSRSQNIDTLPAWSRLILSINKNKREELPEGGIRFPTHQLLPSLIKNRNESWVTLALFFKEEQLGFLLMDSEIPMETIFYVLRRELSGALKGVLLLREHRNDLIKLSQANKTIKQLNKELKDENLRYKAENAVAYNIQTFLLPESVNSIHPDFHISATMLPAAEVGGDYYDVTTDKEGSLWLGIGDVAGHGLQPGIIMMLAQTMHTTLITNFKTTPADALIMINKAMSQNIMGRMKDNHYMTCLLLKYYENGRFQFAGMHIDLLIFRKKTGTCEKIANKGLWLNVLNDISEHTENQTLQLEIGDVLVLYTDGITEAANNKKKMLGLDGLIGLVIRHGDKELENMKEAILQDVLNWNNNHINDDMTLLLVRRKK